MIRRVGMNALRSMQRQDELSAAFDKKLTPAQYNDADFLDRISRAQKRRNDVAALVTVQGNRPLKPPRRR